MRIAILSDIHGNATAFEAVLKDMRQASPDMIFHGGDLADGGSSPSKIVDRIRELGWPGVAGNTDEMLFRPESFHEFSSQTPKLQPVFAVVEQMATVTRERLGDDRLAWLRALPRTQAQGSMTLLHASPGDLWRAPSSSASEEELEACYGRLGTPTVVYGHIHAAYIREMSRMVICNAGSVGLPYDGDPRACYLLLDEYKPMLRRVEYDIDREIQRLSTSGLPHADWTARMLLSARFEMP
ncbi:MAG TPA: metallophosphoesterase family protein [Terriglobales bacterium]|nr:metallophosphoesterase family protein [Terriglobales bacterium]